MTIFRRLLRKAWRKATAPTDELVIVARVAAAAAVADHIDPDWYSDAEFAERVFGCELEVEDDHPELAAILRSGQVPPSWLHFIDQLRTIDECWSEEIARRQAEDSWRSR